MQEALQPYAAMAGYICWKPERLGTVLSPDAMTMANANFLATHVRRPLRRVNKLNTNTVLGITGAEDLLREFLDPLKNHFQAVVVGTSGRGKSRVIRWLAIHAPENDLRRVVLIDKTGTNLHRVIEQILDGMNGAAFDAYRSQLRFAPAVNNADNAPSELLNQLAFAVGKSSRYISEVLEDPDEQDRRELLVKFLPPLLGDPKFREELLKARPIIQALVQHAVGNDLSEQREAPRAFTADDFAVGDWGLSEPDLNLNARPMYQKLRNQASYRNAVAQWVNLNLEDALAKILNFSQTDLGKLFLDVRRTLKEQGRELVLLVEDFARLQGIDYALMDAINKEAGEESDICPLRCVIAMTTGIYDGLPDTFKTRNTAVFSVDQATEDAQEDQRSIAAYHLNVLRHDANAVTQWSSEAIEFAHSGGESETYDLPSACNVCPHRTPCHAAFGSYQTPGGEAFGYYPFTDSAMREMYRRISGRTGETFSPRDLLASVLRDPLQNYTEAVREKRWLPTGIVSTLGNRQMSAPRRAELQALTNKIGASDEDKVRYENLYEIYGDFERLKGISAEVLTAFGLDPLEMGSAAGSNFAILPVPDAVPVPKPDNKTLPLGLAKTIQQLREWSNGAPLEQTPLTAMRNSLFPHIKESIAWDTLFLGEAYHAGTGRIFQLPSLNFDRQVPTITERTPLILTIKRDMAVGIEAALLFDYHHDWSFDTNGVYQLAFIELIEGLGGQVARHLQRCSTTKPLDPAPLAVELLLLHALYSGAYNSESRKDGGPRGEQLLMALVTAPAPQAPPSQLLDSRTLAIFRDLDEHRADLQKLLFARVACTKGDSTSSPSLFDAARLRYALGELARQWTLNINPRPSKSFGDYRNLFDLRDKIRATLPVALETERQKLRQQLETLREQFGADTSAQANQSVLSAIRETSDRAHQEAVWRPNGAREDLLAATNALANLSLRRLRETRERAENGALETARAVPLLFDSEVRDVVTKGEQFAQRADMFLRETATHVEQERNRLGGDNPNDQENLARIETYLQAIVAELTKLSDDAYGTTGKALS